MDKQSKIFLAGHIGLIGSSVFRLLKKEGYQNIITRTKKELDLRNQECVRRFFLSERPEYVIDSAALVGGIKANMDYPTEYMYDNLMIQNNIIWSSFKTDVKKLLYISCGCAYPTNSPQPMEERYILDGKPEPTNEGFAIAKIAGIKLCEKVFKQYKKEFISCIPANTYGIGDHFNEQKSHVIPALIKKIHEAKINNVSQITLWGTGKAQREFIYVDDLAKAILLVMNKYNNIETINIGSGENILIKDLANIVKEVVGYSGEISFDTAKPDGMKKRILNSHKIKNLGFSPSVKIKEGIEKTYAYYKKTKTSLPK